MDRKGISLVSLVIVVIVMLILAGVTISGIIGKNSSLTKAQEAKLSEEERSKRAVIEQALIKFNTGNALNSSDLKSFLKTELKLGDADVIKVTDLNGEDGYVIKDYLGEKAYISAVDGVWKIQKFGSTTLDFGMIDMLEDGDRLIAPQSGEELEIENYNYAIMSSEDLRDISFDIPANTTVNLKLLSDFTITNEGLRRAAINLNEGSVLNLAVYGTVTVNSTYGEDANGAIPGKGGYAGIRVPPSATLNLSGTGTVKAIGGNAGNGPNNYGHGGVYTAGGGGAGAGIGGNGGNGSAGIAGKAQTTKACEDGGSGESCGTINIRDSLKVYAYGGAGGAGGTGGAFGQVGSGGSGGYPGAGIGGGGGGGAGSTCCAGAGGFTAGSASATKLIAQNGLSGYGYGRNTASDGENPLQNQYKAGGYFEGPKLTLKDTNNNSFDAQKLLLGGYAGIAYAYKGHEPGFGGAGGAGGTVVVSSSATVYAYNGSYKTQGSRVTNAQNQCPIYAQSGIITAKYKTIYTNNTTNWNGWRMKLENPQESVAKSGYINSSNGTKNLCSELGVTSPLLQSIDMKCQGVGSGAGYIETSNGTYTISN